MARVEISLNCLVVAVKKNTQKYKIVFLLPQIMHFTFCLIVYTFIYFFVAELSYCVTRSFLVSLRMHSQLPRKNIYILSCGCFLQSYFALHDNITMNESYNDLPIWMHNISNLI